ncbi:MAG: hypothetical protein WD431_13285 [Cyclobacteriaceae bacterium]
MDFHTCSDSVLWKMISRGNQGAFVYVYGKTATEIYQYGLKFTADAELIEDVIQDTFLHIWEIKNRINIKKSIQFYLFSKGKKNQWKIPK